MPGAPAGGSGTAAAATRARWPVYAAAAILALYVATFIRGLGWEWAGIVAGRPGAPMPVQGPSVALNSQPAPPAANLAPAAPAAGTVAQKVPLPPTDEPPPRNATDQYGVYYDEHGVAVLGIDADPGGVYNVPPGRQVRIGGPQGQLFDVHEGGKITPATAVRELPTPVPSS
jgi:hypothetical protein